MSVGDRGRGGRRGRRARVDEDGDGRARAVRRAGQGAARHHRQPGRDRQRPDQAGARRRRRRGGRRGGRSRPRPAGRRRGHGPDDARSTSQGRPDCGRARATTYRPRTRTRPSRSTSPCATRCGRGRVGPGRRARPADDLRRPRGAEPQPTGRRGPAHRAAGAHLAGALPHLPAEPRRRAWWPARAVPRPAGARARALRRGGPRAHPRAGGGRLPHLPGPAALDAEVALASAVLGLLERRDPADRAARGPRPRAAGAPRPRHPVALPGDR